MIINYVLFWIFGNCKVLNTTILNIMAGFLNILISPAFGNNKIVTFYFILFCLFIYLN